MCYISGLKTFKWVRININTNMCIKYFPICVFLPINFNSRGFSTYKLYNIYTDTISHYPSINNKLIKINNMK